MTGRNNDRTSGYRPDFAARLKAGPLPCSKCGKPVYAEDLWDVDHLVNHVEGGRATASNVWVAHRSCNRRAGQKLAIDRTRAKKAADKRMREW